MDVCTSLLSKRLTADVVDSVGGASGGAEMPLYERWNADWPSAIANNNRERNTSLDE